MTDKQALKKARELWGPNAGIDKYGAPGHWWHRVGVMFAGRRCSQHSTKDVRHKETR